MKIDLFKLLQFYVGCMYISDLRLQEFDNKKAKYYLAKINLEEYSFEEIKDAIQYIYGTDIQLDEIGRAHV